MDLTELPSNYYLFYTIVISYFILLFHTFNVKDLKEKVNGIEILFIAGAIGILFYLLLVLTVPVIIIPSIAYLKSLIAIPEISPTLFWYYSPSIVALAFYIVEQLILFAIFWFFLAVFFYAFIRTIEFCLDPSNDIFPKLDRFKVIQKYHLKRVFIFNIPLILLYFSGIVVLLGYNYDFVQNLISFHLDHISVRMVFFTIYAIIGIILSFGAFYILLRLLFFEFIFFLPIISILMCSLKKIDTAIVNMMTGFFDYKDKVKKSISKKYAIERWIFNHWKLTVILFATLFILFLIIIYIQPIYFPWKCYEHPEYRKVLCLPAGPFM